MKKLIFDCDNTMGVKGHDVDDGLALLYLLGKANIEIIGITTTYGNSDIETVHTNTDKMLKEIGRTDLNLYKGCSDRFTLDSEAVDFLVDTVNSDSGNISILATGSLTNLYAAYLKDNLFFEKVAEIIIMGGITEDLVINDKVLDELNLACDPIAAEWVFKKAKNISVITGNNCLDAFFTKSEFFNRLVAREEPSAKYIYEKCMYWFEDMMHIFNIDGFHNWDIVAAVYLAEPALFQNKSKSIRPNQQNLKKGLLDNEQGDGLLTIINTPYIRNLEAFTDDVYNTWLSARLLII